MSSFSYRNDVDLRRFDPHTLSQGLLAMAVETRNKAVINAPKRTRALANSGRVERVTDQRLRVVFGNQRVPYAYIRHEINRLHPWTIHYLSRAADDVARDYARYFRGLV